MEMFSEDVVDSFVEICWWLGLVRVVFGFDHVLDVFCDDFSG